eukprot:1159202-Pelagomonas_calceolata.AAC.12
MARVRACVRACACVCVCVRARACVRVNVCAIAPFSWLVVASALDVPGPVMLGTVLSTFLACDRGAKAFEKAEDPIYALDHNLPIDCQHYLEHHVKQPLLRIFEPVLKNPQAELLQGVCVKE